MLQAKAVLGSCKPKLQWPKPGFGDAKNIINDISPIIGPSRGRPRRNHCPFLGPLKVSLNPARPWALQGPPGPFKGHGFGSLSLTLGGLEGRALEEPGPIRLKEPAGALGFSGAPEGP